jgi:acylphosphatase
MFIARKFLISGRVQGVGYRYFAQRSAARYQILGYVRNLPDRRVEVWAEGASQAVDEFKNDLVAGPTYSKVEQIEETVFDPTRLYTSFRIEK